MSIELTQRVKRLEAELAEVNRQIVELWASQRLQAKDHVVNCTKVMDLVQTVEKGSEVKRLEAALAEVNRQIAADSQRSLLQRAKTKAPTKHGGQVDSSGDRSV